MESLLAQDDWMFPWETMELGGQQMTSGLPDLSSACFESPWLEGIDGLQSTVLLSQSSVDRKEDFTLFDTFQQYVDVTEIHFTDTDGFSYMDSLPSMSPDSQSFAPIEAYEKGLHYADYHSPSPGYTSPSPLGGLSSPGYSSPPPLTIYRSPSLDYSPPQLSVSDGQIQSSMGLNFEDSDIIAALADQNYTLIAPESELLQICDAVSDVNHRFSSPVFDLEMYDESPSPLDSYVQEVPQDYKEHDQAVLEESDPIFSEDPQNIWMRNILEELMIAPELLSPVSSDDVDSVLSGDSLTSAHQPLQISFPDEQNFELSASSPVLPVSANFLSIVNMNPSATSSYDGCGESVLLLSSGYEYKAVSLSHYRSEGPYARPDRRIMKKEQNKTAALRYRHKKREQKGVELTEVEQLELRNEELKNRAADLTREINYLKGLMEEICKT